MFHRIFYESVVHRTQGLPLNADIFFAQMLRVSVFSSAIIAMQGMISDPHPSLLLRLAELESHRKRLQALTITPA